MFAVNDKPKCEYCGETTPQSWSAINRAIKRGKPIYCDRTCAGLGRKSGKTLEQRKEEKRLYDLNYRATSPTLKVRKAAYYQRTKDLVKEAARRKVRMPRHIEYCRQPGYRAKKKIYDQHHRANKHYGEFGEALVALINLENEVAERIDRGEIYATNGTLNKKQSRRREYERFNSN
jgi:hypothetical protein